MHFLSLSLMLVDLICSSCLVMDPCFLKLYQSKYYFCDFSLVIGLAYFHFKLTFMSNASSYVRYMYCNICRRFGQIISLGIKLYCYNFKALHIVFVQKVYSLFCLLCETGLYCPSRVCPTYRIKHCKKLSESS